MHSIFSSKLNAHIKNKTFSCVQTIKLHCVEMCGQNYGDYYSPTFNCVCMYMCMHGRKELRFKRALSFSIALDK